MGANQIGGKKKTRGNSMEEKVKITMVERGGKEYKFFHRAMEEHKFLPIKYPREQCNLETGNVKFTHTTLQRHIDGDANQ